MWKERRRFAINNIRMAMECGAIESDLTPEDIARKSFVNLGRYFADTIKVYHGRHMEIFDQIKVVGGENYLAAKARNKGVIVITGHCGNWELMGVTFAHNFGPCYFVARALNNVYINKILEEIRTVTGNGVIYKDGAVRRIFSLTKKGETIGILMDQAVLREESVAVSFLGRPALTTKLPAMIAQRTGTAVVPIFMHQDDDGCYTITVEPEVPLCGIEDKDKALQVDTQQFSRHIEDFIEKYPTQWLWGHRRWKRAPLKMNEE